jgi:hypothetical protein
VKKLLGILVLLCLSLLMSETSFYSQHLPFQKTKDTEWVFEEKTYDEVWSAVVKALMQIKFGITSSDKEGGLISATKKRGVLDGSYSKEDLPSLSIFVEKIDAGIKVFCQSTKYAGQLVGGNYSKKLLPQIAENLYGKRPK